MSATHVLLVEDNPGDARLVQEMVKDITNGAFRMSHAPALSDALDAVRSTPPPDIILLDLTLPDSNGLDTFHRLQANAYDIPIIILSGLDDHQLALAAVQGGAQDYLPKGEVNPPLLSRSISYAMERKHTEENLLLARQIFETAGEAILVTEPDGSIVDVNPAFAAITGYAREEAVGRTPAMLKSGRHGPEFYANLWNALLTEGRWQGEIWDRRKNGEIYPKWTTINAVTDARGKLTHFVAIFSDITLTKRTEERLHQLAHYDALTSLPNRPLFFDRLRQALAQARRVNWLVGVLFLDLDGFKNVNDRLGHQLGDQLLVRVAERLSGCLRDADTLARLGGDEFTVILSDLSNPEIAGVVAQKIIDDLAAPFRIDGHEIVIGTSIGIAIYPYAGNSVEALTKAADIAMYRAKDLGKGNFQFYRDDIQSQASAVLRTEQELRQALTRNELRLYYQPQIDSASGGIVGAEALLRWEHPRRGLVLPSEFLATAEESRLIVPIGEFVFRRACEQLRDWQLTTGRRLRLSINLSAVQLDEGLLPQLARIIRDTGIDPEQIHLEVSERYIMERPTSTPSLLQRLRELGLRIAVDDFGNGRSNIAYLRRLPVDRLKIDLSLISRIATDEDDLALAQAIITLGHSLHMKVAAVGVESPQEFELLRSSGCDEQQGYHLGRPMPDMEFGRLLAAGDIRM